jgi:hypothetical protein
MNDETRRRYPRRRPRLADKATFEAYVEAIRPEAFDPDAGPEDGADHRHHPSREGSTAPASARRLIQPQCLGIRLRVLRPSILPLTQGGRSHLSTITPMKDPEPCHA